MSILLSVNNLSKSYGFKDLFINLSFSVAKNDKIALLGLNGCGKSTLLKIIVKKEVSDEGEVTIQRSFKIAYVPQNVFYENKTIKEVLLESVKNENLTDLTEFDKDLEVNKWANKVGFEDFEMDASKLSGGWKKRLAIAEAMISSPDLILLDEPTNHLDLEALLWLEKFLQRQLKHFILVSHDRYFLQNVCNRFIELSMAYEEGVFISKGSYLDFLKKKDLLLEGQKKN